ncbi:hypothetical protein [Zhongshania sp.]|uniref:hypothetical protein n=1 Tax=Zhongshania sp. TaxID=1971902 RepID=UPI00356AC52B
MSDVRRLVHQVYFDDSGVLRAVSNDEPLPVTGDWLTDTQLRDSPVDVNVASSTNPTWQELFRYATPDDPALPSGSAVTIDPILNTEPNVIDSGWIRTGVDDGLEKVNQSFTIGGNTALRAYVMNASDDQGNNIRNNDFPFIVTAAGGVRVIQATFFSRYYRILIENISGSTCTELSARSVGGQDTPIAVTTSLDQPLLDSFPAPVFRGVTVGRQPDGDYVNTPADGNVYTHGVALGAGASFTTPTFDTDGWKAIELYVATDQVSLQDGIVVEYTPDAQATTPVWYPGPKFTFGADAVTSGFLVKRFAPALDGFRITYTNGGTPQGSWFFSLELKNGVTEPTGTSIENDIDPSQSALLTRGIEFAQNDSGDYGNITRGPLGGKRVSIYEHESETPIKPLNNLSGNATSVGSGSATQVASAPPAGTKSVEIQADPDNTKIVYVGFNAGLTSGNAPVALQAGDARVYEVNNTPLFYALSASGSQTVRWTYIAEV